MSKQSTSTSSGISLTGLIFLLFLSLKLIGIDPVASWSWWWVAAPLWVPLVIAIGGFIFYLFIQILTGKF